MNNINDARKRLAQAEDEIRKDQDRQSAAINIDELINRLKFRMKKLEGPGYLMPNCVADLKDAIDALREQQNKIHGLEASNSALLSDYMEAQDRIEEITVLLEKRSKRIRF